MVDVRQAFSPLDKELGLLSGELTPRLQESLARLGTWMPFARAAEEFKHFTRTEVSEATVRRVTEDAGSDYVSVQNEEAERIEKQLPVPCEGPELQLMSVDGAYVPLVNREWIEAKTLAIGVVEQAKATNGKKVVHTRDLSYFSRTSEASKFCKQALVETHRRGTERAKKVCAVTDGAAWEQGFIDYHRSDAIRILDFAHAAESVAEAGRAIYGEGTPQFGEWFGKQRHLLRRGQVDCVLSEIRRLRRKASRSGTKDRLEIVEASLGYLEKRREMIEYGKFHARGYPIGSGCVESANKVVVESRLKQAGMHWAQAHVDPMLALRNVACNERWAEAWPQIARKKQQRTESTIRGKRKCKQEPRAIGLSSVLMVGVAWSPAEKQAPSSVELAQNSKPYRPGPNHPWRRIRFGKARYTAKL